MTFAIERDRVAFADAKALLKTDGPQAVHDRWCDGGAIEIVDAEGYERVWMCPKCEADKRLASMQNDIARSGIGERYLHTEWSDFTDLPDPMPALKAASERITDILESGHSAILTGPAGSGKTQAAVLLVKAAIRAGKTAALANIGHEAVDIRAGYDGDGPSERKVIQRLSSPDLLVLDDVGAGEADSGKIERRILYLVADARQNARRSTIVTTNLTAQELAKQLGDRVVNRLMPVKPFAFRHGRNFRKPDGRNAWEAA